MFVSGSTAAHSNGVSINRLIDYRVGCNVYSHRLKCGVLRWMGLMDCVLPSNCTNQPQSKRMNERTERMNGLKGVNFMEKTISLKNTDITFRIWDLGGQQEYLHMLPLV